MKRRQFITCFGATVAANTLTWSLTARAQQPAMPSGALPSSAKPDNPANGLDPLLQQAQTLGAPMAAVARAITISRRCAGKVPQMAPPSAPEAFERSSAQLRVSGGVLDVGMAQPKLQPPGIMACVSQEMPASVTQNVRMQVVQSRSISGSLDHLGDVRARRS
jgi:hypothetical protein